MITFHDVLDSDQLVLVACNQEADRVASIRLRITRASSARVAHVAKFVDCGIIGSVRRVLRAAHATPQIA